MSQVTLLEKDAVLEKKMISKLIALDLPKIGAYILTLLNRGKTLNMQSVCVMTLPLILWHTRVTTIAKYFNHFSDPVPKN